MRDPTSPGLTREEGIALVIAIAAHVALIAALTLSPPGKNLQPPPQRMTVTFSDEIANQSTSPDPNAQAAADVAPDLGEPQPEQVQPAPPQPAPPQPAPPQPLTPRPAPVVQPVPRPVPQPAPRMQPAPPKAAPSKPAAPAAKPADERPRRRPDAPVGGSRVGNDFLKGIPGSTAPGTAHTPPAETMGPEVRSSLVSAISRQIKPHWITPQGVDAEKLVTVLAWNLNPDGSLAGAPTVVQQLGITDTNRAQARLHAEQALKAVRLAAPFNLPPQYYNAWKRVTAFRFDRKLSQ